MLLTSTIWVSNKGRLLTCYLNFEGEELSLPPTQPNELLLSPVLQRRWHLFLLLHCCLVTERIKLPCFHFFFHVSFFFFFFFFFSSLSVSLGWVRDAGNPGLKDKYSEFLFSSQWFYSTWRKQLGTIQDTISQTGLTPGHSGQLCTSKMPSI